MADQVKTFATRVVKDRDLDLSGAREIIAQNFGTVELIVNDSLRIPRSLTDSAGNTHPFTLHLSTSGLEENQVWRLKFSGTGTKDVQIITRK